MMMPLPVRMTEVRSQVAELTFMEQGIITAENTVLVFPTAQGELNGLYVREGQEIQVGEILLSVNDTALRLQLDQVRSGILGLEAQLSNVGVEDALMRQTLQANRNSLQGELQAINAQAEESYRAYVSHQESIYEQMRIQQVLIDQHQNELERVRDNFQRVESLYQSGVATRTDLESANAAITAADSLLEAAQGQLALIAAGTPQTTGERFEGMRSSINAQIAGINQQLAQDTTTAARAHFQALIAIEQASIARLEHELANTTVSAPISGTITTLHAQHTNFISAASPVAEITVAGSLTIDVYVSTQDVSSIQIGDTVGLTLRQRVGDVEFYGRITDIDNTAIVRLTALGIEERKVKVQIEPDIPAEVQLGLGHAVDVTFYVFREENRLTVPRTAVFRYDSQEKVWVVLGDPAGNGNGDGQVQLVPVVTGMELRTDIIIESGLAVGDFVVNDANNQDLREGVRVTNER